MKKAVLGTVILISGVSLWAAGDLTSAVPLPEVASAHGSVTWEAHHGKEQGVGMLAFDVQQHGRIFGSLVFAAEHGHDFPDIVIQLDDIRMLEFTQNTVRFAGVGALLGEPVFITLHGIDGESAGRVDSFELKCIDIAGEEVFEAVGELSIGHLTVGEPH